MVSTTIARNARRSRTRFKSMSDRPKRRAIPLAVKVEACLIIMRQHGLLGDGPVHWDHHPALELRPVNADGTDFDPPQHSASHIQPLAKVTHDLKTNGNRERADGDKTRIAKTKRLEANRLAAQIMSSLAADSLPEWKPKWKRAWPSRKFETRKRT